MTPDTLTALRSRIERIWSVARRPAAEGFTQSHTLQDGTTHGYAISGVKSPEQFQDELLSLYIWVWSLKDHLKETFEAQGMDPRDVEEIANQTPSLQFVSDIANRAKHGVLRKSRSGKFAELVEVEISIPQTALSRITVGAFHVGMDVVKPDEVILRAKIQPNEGPPLNAFTVLADALSAWESRAVVKLRP